MRHRAFVRVLSPLAATGAILLVALSASAAGGPTLQPNGPVNADKAVGAGLVSAIGIRSVFLLGGALPVLAGALGLLSLCPPRGPA